MAHGLRAEYSESQAHQTRRDAKHRPQGWTRSESDDRADNESDDDDDDDGNAEEATLRISSLVTPYGRSLPVIERAS